MTQYVLKKDDEAKELLYALQKYEPVRIVLSAFSLGKRKNEKAIGKFLEGEKLEMKVEKDWKIYISGEEIVTIHLDPYQTFKIEYQNDKMTRIYPYFEDNPDDKNMPEPTYSVFRNVVDDYLLEIWFKGKIPLEKDGEEFWKIKK